MRGSPGRRLFTLHVDFLAVDEKQARHQAAIYAEGLNQLRSEVEGYTACVSLAGEWSASTAVFCGSPGPDEMDVCVDGAGHAGLHHGPGGSGQWHDPSTETSTHRRRDVRPGFPV